MFEIDLEISGGSQRSMASPPQDLEGPHAYSAQSRSVLTGLRREQTLHGIRFLSTDRNGSDLEDPRGVRSESGSRASGRGCTARSSPSACNDLLCSLGGFRAPCCPQVP